MNENEILQQITQLNNSLNERFNSIDQRLGKIETKIDALQTDMNKVLKFVPVANADFDTEFQRNRIKEKV